MLPWIEIKSFFVWLLLFFSSSPPVESFSFSLVRVPLDNRFEAMVFLFQMPS